MVLRRVPGRKPLPPGFAVSVFVSLLLRTARGGGFCAVWVPAEGRGCSIRAHRNIICEDTSTYLLNCLLVAFESGRRQERHIVRVPPYRIQDASNTVAPAEHAVPMSPDDVRHCLAPEGDQHGETRSPTRHQPSGTLRATRLTPLIEILASEGPCDVDAEAFTMACASTR